MEWEEDGDGEAAAGSGGGALPYAVARRGRRRRGEGGGRRGASASASWSSTCSTWWKRTTGEGWWREARYAVSFPSCRDKAELPASLVRPRRAFVRGRWMDAREVVPRVPQYDEGSNVEVMLNNGKHRAVWMTATVIKMVSSTNYIVRLKNKEGSVHIVHCRHIRPQPIFDRKKFEYELELSAEVEVYLDGAWLLGVISDVGSCGYGIRVKGIIAQMKRITCLYRVLYSDPATNGVIRN